jgi:hypothetical protein
VTKVRIVRQRSVDEEQCDLPDAAPALILPELAGTIHGRLARNKEEAARNNKYPEEGSLLDQQVTLCYCDQTLDTVQ